MNRAYRISFSPRASKFVVEIQGFAGLYWVDCKDGGSKVRYFETFDDANTYVKRIGLNQVYSDFTFQRPYGSPKVSNTINWASAPPPKSATWNIPYQTKEQDA